MRRDYLIAIILALAAVPLGAALMVAPEYLHLTGWQVTATFWGGIALTVFLILVAAAIAWHGTQKASKKSELESSPPEPFVALDFVWHPGGANDDVVLSVAITGRKTAKDIVILGRYAVAVHYMTSCEWKWSQSVRLYSSSNMVKGERYDQEIFRRARKGKDIAQLFGRAEVDSGQNDLVLVRLDIASAEGSAFVQKAFHLRKFGEVLDSQPIHLDDIAYIEGLDPDTGTATS